MKPTITTGYPIDVERLLETRALLQASSGFGKSWALRRLLEQTAPKVQQLVIDPEGEFATLREKFDYVICAPHDGDAIASPRTAALLARRLLETGVSAILNIYDLKRHERQAFVDRFLTALVDAPKSLWRPVLIVLDEAHIFAPEQEKAESTGAVIDIASRGRKRGQCLIVATQRIAKLNKDVAAEMTNKMIGRCGLDIDVKRAAQELGMTPKDATESFRSFSPGDFFIFGPALTPSVERIAVGPVTTTHPKAGARLQAPPAPSAKIKGLIAAELADLPQQAEHEIRTLEDAKRELADVRRKLTIAEKQRPATIVESPELPRLREEVRGLRVALKAATETAKQADSRLRKIVAIAGATMPAARAEPVTHIVLAPTPRPKDPAPPATKAARPRTNGQATSDSGPLAKGERAVLTAIAQHEEGVDREQITILTGYKRSTRDAYIQRLQAAGLVDAGPPITATEAGLAVLPADFAPLPTGAALREHWLARLPEGERAVFEVLVDAYPEAVSRDAITDATMYKRSTRDAYLQRLGTRKLVVKRGDGVAASDALFS